MQKISKEKEDQIERCLKMGLSMKKTAKAASVAVQTVQRVRDERLLQRTQNEKTRPNIPQCLLGEWDEIAMRITVPREVTRQWDQVTGMLRRAGWITGAK